MVAMRFFEPVKHAFSQVGRIVTAGFQVDLRSLAVARMAFGSLLVVDLVNRVGFLEAHYADAGVLPRKALLALGSPRWYVSLHLMSGEPAVQLVLFAIAGVLAVMLVLGYRTRLMTCLCWLLLMSLHNRNQLILNGGDSLFRILLFWAMFVPWGARWSVDRALTPDAETGPDQVFSVGALAFFVQTCAVYFFTGLLKSGADWWESGLAVYYALSLDIMRLPLGTYVYQFPEFMRFMTTATLWLELAGPFIFFIPFRNAVFRWLGVAVFAIFQLGLGATLQVGLFPWVSIAALVAFLPSATWERGNFRFLERGFEGIALVARRFRIKGAQPFVALSKLEGVVVMNTSDGTVLDTVPLPTGTGLASSVIVANAVSVDADVAFISNGEAGVYVAQNANGDFSASGASGPVNLTVIGQLQFGSLESVNHVAFKSGYLFVAAGLGGLKIVKVDGL